MGVSKDPWAVLTRPALAREPGALFSMVKTFSMGPFAYGRLREGAVGGGRTVPGPQGRPLVSLDHEETREAHEEPPHHRRPHALPVDYGPGEEPEEGDEGYIYGGPVGA